jgi:hypothetical protein
LESSKGGLPFGNGKPIETIPQRSPHEKAPPGGGAKVNHRVGLPLAKGKPTNGIAQRGGAGQLDQLAYRTHGPR